MNNSIALGVDVASDNRLSGKSELSFRDNWRAWDRQGMIWRALGNFALNNVQLWHVVISAKDTSLEWIAKSAIIKPYLANMLRRWRYRVKTLQYVLIASGGDNGRNPHYHIIATAPLGDTDNNPVIDYDCKPIIDSPEDRKWLARYCEKNMLQDAPFTSQEFRKSKGFERWANSAVYRLYHAINGDNDSPVTVYVHNMTKSPLSSPVNNSQNDYHNAPMHQCIMCNNWLPRTPNYFHKNGKYLRTNCMLCQRLENMNNRAKSIGAIGIVSVADVHELDVIASGVDMWNFEPLTEPSLDHIVPLSQGGYNVIDNVMICNQSTNSAKGSMDVVSWLHKLASIGVRHPFIDSYAVDIAVQRDMFASA